MSISGLSSPKSVAPWARGPVPEIGCPVGPWARGPVPEIGRASSWARGPVDLEFPIEFLIGSF